MRFLKAGKELIELVKLCYKADQPVLLVGKHGVGKSEIMEQATGKSELKINFICRDLSLMEPPDLVGMPNLSESRTHYFPPAFLPSEGKGLLVFEELNRCPSYIRAPCLQLLTARTLNDYILPKGWLPCAAINPSEESYDVQDLDPALLSRFVQVGVKAGRKEWLTWAKENKLHNKVLSFVDRMPKLFNGIDDQSNPRSWTKVAKILAVNDDLHSTVVQTAITGLVGIAWCAAFVEFFNVENLPPTSVAELITRLTNKEDLLTELVSDWMEAGRTDLIDSVAYVVNLLLQNKEEYFDLIKDQLAKIKLIYIIEELPPDLVDKKRLDQLKKEQEDPFT